MVEFLSSFFWQLLEMGRQDVTAAAVRACKNAISSNSIPAFRTGIFSYIKIHSLKLLFPNMVLNRMIVVKRLLNISCPSFKILQQYKFSSLGFARRGSRAC